MAWLIVAAVILIAAFSIYRAFQNPKFVARITGYVARKAWKTVIPAITASSEETQKAAQERARRGEERPPPFGHRGK